MFFNFFYIYNKYKSRIDIFILLSYFGLLAGYWWKNHKQVRDNFFKEDNHYNKAVDFLKKKHKDIEIIQDIIQNMN